MIKQSIAIRGKKPFNTKEKKMATTKELQQQVANLNMRISDLKDELYTLREELSRFRTDVASDVKYLTSAVDTAGGRGGR